jgi:hypothetical protein
MRGASWICTVEGGRMSKRSTLGSAGRRSAKNAPSATLVRMPTAASAVRRRSRLCRRAMTGAGTPAFDPASAIQRSSCARSRADCQRLSGSFCRQRSDVRSSPEASTAGAPATGRGCSLDDQAISELVGLERGGP